MGQDPQFDLGIVGIRKAVSVIRDKGFAETMFGRRRPVPELKSSNFMQRSFGERVAMNSPIQGSGADIMKIAMIRVWEELLRRGHAVPPDPADPR